MKLATTKNANLNYLAKIVKIENFTPHPDPETTRLKVAHIDGFNLVVGIDSQPGIYVYFPTSIVFKLYVFGLEMMKKYLYLLDVESLLQYFSSTIYPLTDSLLVFSSIFLGEL